MKKIAMIGMFRGYRFGEYNPGCFIICLKTYQELKKRIENCKIDIFAVDNDNTKDEIYTEHKDGLDINFFPAKKSVSLLNSYFSKYDALVIGGDVIWGDYYEEKCPLFFIDSEPFLKTTKPLVLFNCVHRFTPMKDNENLFANLKKRANYIAVRTESLKDELDEIGEAKDIKAIPDPVIDHELKKITKKVNEKPLMGISISNEFVEPLISILRHTDLSKFNVCFYPYSRQYLNLETVKKIKDIFGDQFSYILEYKEPMKAIEMIGSFDISVNDTYHGTIAAIVQDVPFICINSEPPATSRVAHLLRPFQLENQYVSPYPREGEDELETMGRCFHKFNALINNPPKVKHDQLKKVKELIQSHFDDMAYIINNS